MFLFKLDVAKLLPEIVKKSSLCTTSKLKIIHVKMTNTERIG